MLFWSSKKFHLIPKFIDSLFINEALWALREDTLLSTVHQINFLEDLPLDVFISELDTQLILQGLLFELLVEVLLLHLEVAWKVHFFRNIIAILLLVLRFVLGKLIHNRLLDGFLFLTDSCQTLLHMRVLHLMLPKPQDKIVTEFLNFSKNVEGSLRCFLWLLVSFLEQFFRHSA